MKLEAYQQKLQVEVAKIAKANLRHDSWSVIDKARRDGITFEDALAAMPPGNSLRDEKRSARPNPENTLSPLSPLARSRTAHAAAKRIYELLAAADSDAQLTGEDSTILWAGVKRALISTPESEPSP